jgi:hypothetical protein
MNLEFKFSLINIITFIVLGVLCYWLIPMPSALAGRVILRALIAVVLFFMCFVVVSHRSFIRKK